jgi:hypothetical protein
MSVKTRRVKGKKSGAERTDLHEGKVPRIKLRTPVFPYIREIHRRAQMMTPLLKEILEFRPGPRWYG